MRARGLETCELKVPHGDTFSSISICFLSVLCSCNLVSQTKCGSLPCVRGSCEGWKQAISYIVSEKLVLVSFCTPVHRTTVWKRASCTTVHSRYSKDPPIRSTAYKVSGHRPNWRFTYKVCGQRIFRGRLTNKISGHPVSRKCFGSKTCGQRAFRDVSPMSSQ